MRILTLIQSGYRRAPAVLTSLTLPFYSHVGVLRASVVAQMIKNPPAMQETWFRSPGREDPLQKEMAPGFCLEIPFRDKPGMLSYFSCVQLLVTPWTEAHQALPCHFLCQGIFLTQGSNQCLLMSPCIGRQILYHCTIWEALL